MSLAQWTTASTGATGTSYVPTLDTTNPAQGAKSMTYQVSNPSTTATGNIQALTGWSVGVTARNVIVRSMIRPIGTDNLRVGVFCLVQGSLSIGSTCYSAYMDGTPRVQLEKGTITNGTGTVLGTTSVSNFTQNSWYAIQLECETNPLTNDVFLNVWTDGPIVTPATYDYSTLAARLSVTDSTTPYGAGITAGVMASQSGAFINNLDRICSFDFTQLAWC